MMMLPSVWGDNLFGMWDPFDKDFFGGRNPLYGKNEKNLMKTDVRETQDAYEVDVDLPGFRKEDVSVKLENGYLTINASKSMDKEDKQDDKSYLRRERFVGSCSRSFYVGDGIRKEDIHAKLEDGILRMTFPKKDQKELEEHKTIAIEG